MCFHHSALNSKLATKDPSSVTDCRRSFSGRRSKWGCLRASSVGVQNQVEHFAGDTRERSFTLEGRYALANWNKLPLNPAISAEYRFGLSDGLPDSGELALLISHDFPHEIEWALNIFVDREFGGKARTADSRRASKCRFSCRKRNSRSDSKCNTAAAARLPAFAAQRRAWQSAPH